jgi:hypothetical protein
MRTLAIWFWVLVLATDCSRLKVVEFPPMTIESKLTTLLKGNELVPLVLAPIVALAALMAALICAAVLEKPP